MSSIRKCIICCDDLSNPQAKYCSRCRKIVSRIDTRRKYNREARIEALQNAWDGKVFRCYYTDIELIEDNHKDPRYLTYDHRTPRQEEDIVIVAQAINDMKSDMTDGEFRRMVIQLARRFDGGRFNKGAFNLKHWKR